MNKHTTLNVDTELLAAARQALGTRGTTDTIRRALEEVVNRQRRERLLTYDYSSLIDDLEEMRSPRVFPRAE